MSFWDKHKINQGVRKPGARPSGEVEVNDKVAKVSKVTEPKAKKVSIPMKKAY